MEGSRRMRRAGGLSGPGVLVGTGRGSQVSRSSIYSFIHSLSLNKNLVSVYFVPSTVLGTRDKNEQVTMALALFVYGLHGGYQHDTSSTTGNGHSHSCPRKPRCGFLE